MAIFQNAIVTYKAGGITPTTWNPSDKNANITLSNGNLTGTWSSAANVGMRATHPIADGQKLYYEVTLNTVNGSYGICPGVVTSNESLTSNWAGNASCCNWRKDNSFTYFQYGTTAESTLTTGNILGIAVTRVGTTVKVYIHLNGTYPIAGDASSTPNPGAGTNPQGTYTLSSNNICAGCSQRDGTNVITANFGASAFSYSVPTDFSAGWGAAK